MKHYCDFKIIKETDEVIIEVCRECKRKLKTIKGKSGRTDNKKYLEEHMRDFCQREGNTKGIFKKYYGKGNEFKRTMSQDEYEED